MANNCCFDMKITGPEEGVRELISMLKSEHPSASIGRVFSFDVDETLTERSPDNPNIISVTGQGDCAWSMNHAMRRGFGTALPLDGAVEQLGLAVEAFSSEPCDQFQEHILIVKGIPEIDDRIHYEEYLVEDPSENTIRYLLEEKHLTREELMSKVNRDGLYCFGGFDNYGEFEDLFVCFPEKGKSPLSSQIAAATEKVSAISKGKNRDMEI